MPHSYGRRARTRQMFSQSFRKHGLPSLTRYLTAYRVGDIVDIKADSSIHGGMPYKFYHGRTGVVFNVTKSSVGVEVMKPVKHRLLRKRINVRIEHVTPSRSRENFLERVKENDEASRKAKATGQKVVLKRLPPQPREGYVLEVGDQTAITMRAVKFDYNI